MTGAPALYFILIGVGITAIGIVVLLYFLNRRKSIESPASQMVNDGPYEEPIQSTVLTESQMYKQLAVYRSDQPVFLRMAENMLAQVMSKSDTMLLRQIVREYDVKGEFIDKKTEILNKLAAYGEADHRLKRQSHEFGQADEKRDVTHDRDMKKLKMEIEALTNPPPTVSRPSAEDVTKMREEERKKRIAEFKEAVEEDREFKRIREAAEREYNEEKRQHRLRILDKIRDEFVTRKAELIQEVRLSTTEKDAELKALQKEFIRQLEEFERTL